jgi:hypothetical protein
MSMKVPSTSLPQHTSHASLISVEKITLDTFEQATYRIAFVEMYNLKD